MCVLIYLFVYLFTYLFIHFNYLYNQQSNILMCLKGVVSKMVLPARLSRCNCGQDCSATFPPLCGHFPKLFGLKRIFRAHRS